MTSVARTNVGARAIAVTVLVRVIDDRAFAAAALDAELGRHAGLDRRDAALATELVYGVLRVKGYLEERLEAFSKRGLPRETNVLATLLVGAYTIAFLDRIPAFAAVNEAVEATRGAHGGKAQAGYVNAVLRAFAGSVAAEGKPALADALVRSAPGWLRGSLRRSLGRAGANAFLAAGKETPRIGLAVRDESARDAIVERLRAARPSAEIALGEQSPRAIVVRGADDPEALPGFGSASSPDPHGEPCEFIVQEEGAQLVALALGARPGERVLDACAGRGNKSWFLAREVTPNGSVVAADLHPSKIADLANGPAGREGVQGFAVDWTAGSGDVPDGFDRALVDAPCSGIGTIARRPEIALVRTPDAIRELAALQIAIARRVATRVRDGGRLLFAVCSVLEEETNAIVAALIERTDAAERFAPAPIESRAPAFASGAETFRLLPSTHGTDGYFVASFRIRRSP